MPKINRIIGFVSISFVLLFIAKINKIELYTAYFRTISDVEIRNSHALRLEGIVHVDAADLLSEVTTPDFHTSAAGLLHGSLADKVHRIPVADVATALPAAPLVMRPLVPQCSPRAPDSHHPFHV
jgi:hypothetical protein